MAAPKRAAASLLAIAGLLVPHQALAQEPDPLHEDRRFAASLFREQDYFRAIGAYKRLAFDAPAGEDAPFRLAIAESYRRSDRPRSAIPVAARLLASPDGATRDRASLLLVASYFALRSRPLAEPYLPAARRADPFATDAYALLAAVEERRPAETERLLVALAAEAPAARKVQALGFRERVRAVEASPTRSPALAGILSTIVPGAGQLYAGHPVDAAQAALFVGAFAAATVASARYEHDRGAPYVLTALTGAVTLTFHVTNIYGAARAADQATKSARAARLAPLRDEVADLPLWEPPPSDFARLPPR